MSSIAYARRRPFEELPEDLRTLAELALSEARRELEQTGKLNPAVGLQEPNGNTTFLHLTDEMSDALFDNQHGKALYFAALRQTVQEGGVTAVILINDIWTGKTTKEFESLPAAERKRIVENAPSISVLVKRGLMTRAEAVMVTVQTPEQVAVIEQLYEHQGERILFGARTAGCFAQSGFAGRMKMYGSKEE